MGTYLEMRLSNKALGIASKFAWDNKFNMTIIYNKTCASYVVVDESEECEDDDYVYIKVDEFETYDDLSEYIATEIIGG